MAAILSRPQCVKVQIWNLRWSQSVQQFGGYNIHKNLGAWWECPEGPNRQRPCCFTYTGQDESIELEMD